MLLLSRAMESVIRSTNNYGEVRMLKAIGMVAAASFSIVLMVYNSLISDDLMMIPAILLNIISLVTVLFRPRKLVSFWIGFTFIFFLFLSILLFFVPTISVTTKDEFNPLLASVLFSIILFSLLLPQPSYITSISSDRINVERLGRIYLGKYLGKIYSQLFFVQTMFLLVLTYASKAGMRVKALTMLIDIVFYSIIVYEFDQRARFKVSPLTNVLRKISNIPRTILNILRRKYKFYEFIESIERSLHKIKCFSKPIIEELETDILLGLLISLPVVIVLAFSNSSRLDQLIQLIIKMSALIASILFISSVGIRLYRECHINLGIGILPPSFLFGKSEKQVPRQLLMPFNVFVYILVGMVLTLIALLLVLAKLPIWLLVLIMILVLIAMISTTLFILILTTMVAIAMIWNYLPQILNLQADEGTMMNLILLSIITFTMFIAFSSITCLRHNVICSIE